MFSKFIHSFNKYLFVPLCLQDTVLDTGYMLVRKSIQSAQCPRVYDSDRETDVNQIDVG